MITFEETGLNRDILSAIKDLGFESPTPVQEKAIPALLESEKDLIALAQTGTGKTAAFGLPIIQQIDVDNNNIQSLILCPTRELCMQITNDLNSYSTKVKNLEILAVYGGANIQPQIKSLKKGVHIVVATPGRAIDLIKRKILKISSIKWLVLDEADEMLNMGFQEDINTILAETPKEKQVMLFSATMPNEIMRITEKYMNDPHIITIGKRNTGAENVKHAYYMVRSADRYKALKRIADVNPHIYGIVFCRTRAETKDVADKLISDGYNADALHGDLSQAQRDHVMKRFRQKQLQTLVATDVAARGLDVNDLTHIINYNLPDDLEAYVHRSGRTGRAGKDGISITIIHSRETRKIRELEKMVNKKFEHKKVPNGKEICEKQLFNLVDTVENIEINESQIEQYLPIIYKKLEWLSREDLIKHFISVEFNRFLSYYKNAPDLNVDSSKREKGDRGDKGARKDRSNRETRNTSRKRRAEDGFDRFFVNLGSKNKLNPARLIGLINEALPNEQIDIGRIDIMAKFSFFEAEKGYAKEFTKAFKKINFEGQSVSVELSKPDPKGNRKEKNEYPDKKRKRKDSRGGFDKPKRKKRERNN